MRTVTRSSTVVGLAAAASLLGGCWLPEPQPEPVGLLVSPNPVSWQIEAGGGVGTQQVTISTDVDASEFSLAISGTGFSIGTTTCPPSGGTLAAGTSCTAMLGFASADVATEVGQLFVIADNPDGDDISISVGLSGVAII